jgi:cytochrome c556
MRKSAAVLTAATSAALAACAVNVENHAPPPPPAIDAHKLVDARKGGMAMSVAALGAISTGLANKAPTKSYRLPADGLAHFAQSLPALFDPRTQGDAMSKASPAIWSDPAGFAARVDQYGAATERLLAAVTADDTVAIEAALASTKAACKACHDTYQLK